MKKNYPPGFTYQDFARDFKYVYLITHKSRFNKSQFNEIP